MSVEQDLPADSTGGVPYRLWIGVTGHRTLGDVERLSRDIDKVLARIRTMAPSSPAMPVRLGIVSPLAEGADRLVAQAVLRDDDAALEVALPLAPDDYAKDFQTETSRQEFFSLLDRARIITVMPSAGSREEAYAQVGHYVVDRCDVLVALWDGLPPRGVGGTADTVAHARENGVPLFLVNTNDGGGRALHEVGRGLPEQDFLEVDAFNRAQVPPDGFKAEVRRLTGQLLACSSEVGLDQAAVEPYLAWSVPHLVRADLLARWHQRRYLMLGSLLFGISFLAVAIAAVQSLSPSYGWLNLVEVLLMVFLLITVLYGRRRRVHARWISYRRLAERFRIALFQGVAALGLNRLIGWERIDLDPSRDWVRRLFEEAWITRPLEPRATFDFPALRQFLVRAWLEDQLAYHMRTMRRNERRERRLGRAIASLFGLTLAVALARVIRPPVGEIQNALLLLSTAAPALATALSGIRAQREYLQQAENSRQLANQLRVLRRRMQVAPDLASLQAITNTTGMLMVDENQDWYTTMRPHDFEVQL
jgi:hypothetical protein